MDLLRLWPAANSVKRSPTSNTSAVSVLPILCFLSCLIILTTSRSQCCRYSRRAVTISWHNRRIEALPAANLHLDALQPALGRSLHQNVGNKNIASTHRYLVYCRFKSRRASRFSFLSFFYVHATKIILLVLGISDSSHARSSETLQHRGNPPSSQQGEDEQGPCRRCFLRYRVRV